MISIPRPASTVALMDNQSRVYLTKRPLTMKFLGGYYVFPGGSVEREDHFLENESIKRVKPAASFGHGHYVAAVRELFEEVGILLCSRDDGSPGQLTNRTKLEYRRLLINGEISFIQLLKQEGLQLNLEQLTYFGHRITPAKSPFRFDTRFFLAKLPSGQEPNPDQHEITEAFWITPNEALIAHQNGTLPMVSPTLASLRTILNYQMGGELLMPSRQA